MSSGDSIKMSLFVDGYATLRGRKLGSMYHHEPQILLRRNCIVKVEISLTPSHRSVWNVELTSQDRIPVQTHTGNVDTVWNDGGDMEASLVPQQSNELGVAQCHVDHTLRVSHVDDFHQLSRQLDQTNHHDVIDVRRSDDSKGSDAGVETSGIHAWCDHNEGLSLVRTWIENLESFRQGKITLVDFVEASKLVRPNIVTCGRQKS